MDTFFTLITKVFLYTHISAGFASIVIFWLPMFSKKGSDFHIKTGKWYVRAMWVVVITAALLSIKNVMIKNYDSAIFLGFLSLITSGPLWYGIEILKLKKGRSDSYKRRFFIFHLTVFVSAIAMIIYGLNIESGARILMFIFGGLGMTSIPDVYRYLRNKESNRTWIQDHLIGMITTGVAAYTAFLVFGGQRIFAHLFTGNLVIILWTAPGVLGTFANFYYARKFGKKKV